MRDWLTASFSRASIAIGPGVIPLVCLAVSAGILRADPGGDLAQQQPHWKIDHIPPAPILTPEDELKTFKLPPGFKIELVAAEPSVEEPIALAFDPDGRMYVDELRAYMPDMKGTGELEPIGRIVRLESTKGDGVYDKQSVFIDKLVIPRAVGLAGDGVLVSEPPNLYFCRDTNGDGKADTKELVFGDYATRSANPEHMANGLVWMMDNWCYSANWPGRFRYVKGKFIREGTISRGQWGITQDDCGRLFYNSNSSMLRTDVVPAQFLTRNPYLPEPAGVNVQVSANAVFPSRVNPGVNRGYTADVNDKGYLQRVTAACSPLIYRGGAFGVEYEGNAFVCEPSGNLICRHVLTTTDLSVKGKSVQQEGVDFLTSTDERFRPVSIYGGPDGAIYVIDLYHGILQHKAYLSAYLADQVKQRDLENNDGHRGRIWRIVPTDFKQPAPPALSKATSAELVKTLTHANGWWRDTAQRLLVERAESKTVPALQKMIAAGDSGRLAKIHALWVLQGMDKLEDETVAAALKDADGEVRVQALRAGEMLIRKRTGAETLAALPGLANDPNLQVQLQVLCCATPENAELQGAANDILTRHLSDKIFRAAALSGAAGRELELLQSLMADASFAKAADADKHPLLNDLAECVIRGRSADRIDKLFDLIAAIPAKQKSTQLAMMNGILQAVTPDPKSNAPKRKLRMAHEPAGLAILLKTDDANLAEGAKKADEALSWPDKPGDKTPPLTPLTELEGKRFAAGKDLFTQLCAVCHQPSGLGMEGVAPPLVDSDWLLGTPERPVRIVLNGLTGPIKIGKATFEAEMPALKALSDEQIASVLTYLRREWGHESDPVDPKLVAKIREETTGRGDLQWTAPELSKIK